MRDNPPATADDDFEAQMFGQRSVYNANRPEVHEVIRRWRRIADSYDPPRILVGETPVKVEELAAYYGNGHDELHLAFNFPFIDAPLEAVPLRAVVEETEARPARRGLAGLDGLQSRHVAPGHPLGQGRPVQGPRRPGLLSCLRGTPVLYQGDEIGLPNQPVPHAALRDPLGVRYWPYYEGRDAMRTPMPWREGPGGRVHAPGGHPWLPLGDPADCNVEGQRHDEGSVLHLVRDLLALRRRTEDLRSGDFRPGHGGRPVGLAPRDLPPGGRGTCPTSPPRSTRCRAACSSAPTADATGSAQTGPLRLGGWEDLVVELRGT